MLKKAWRKGFSSLMVVVLLLTMNGFVLPDWVEQPMRASFSLTKGGSPL